MSDPSPDPAREPQRELETLAHSRAPGLVSELFDFLKHSKRWYLVPILLILLLLGVLVAIGASAVGPFIYTVF